MRYRTVPKTGDRISEIGMGSSFMFNAGQKAGSAAIRRAFEGGINFYDMAAGSGKSFPICGEALKDVRRQVIYQIHFGADYSTGDYAKSYDPDAIRRTLDWQLATLHTDYIDYSFIHCLDAVSDWERYKKNGVLDLIWKMQEEGTVRHVGFSTHTPAVAHHVMDEVPLDLLMFSINPAFDYGRGRLAHGSADDRLDLYRRCEREQVGITVMKAFFAGQLLSEKTSPFGRALSQYQCIRYALDKPGVLSVLPGAQSMEEVEQLLVWGELSDAETDYSELAAFAPPALDGKCAYCNHCKPCPAGLDVGLINKYYDLALAGDGMAKDHYLNLEKTAADCIGCGHCDDVCPFHVPQSARMQEIRTYFGR